LREFDIDAFEAAFRRCGTVPLFRAPLV